MVGLPVQKDRESGLLLSWLGIATSHEQAPESAPYLHFGVQSQNLVSCGNWGAAKDRLRTAPIDYVLPTDSQKLPAVNGTFPPSKMMGSLSSRSAIVRIPDPDPELSSRY